MGTKPVLPLIFSMALPAMFSMLVQALYNVVDSVFVSQYDPVNALAAVSLAFPVQMLIVSVGVGTGVGLNSLISRRLGEGRNQEANDAATHGIFLGVCSWLVFLLFGIFLVEPFFNAFSENATLVNMAVSYTRICTVFSFGTFIEIFLEKTLQATGDMIHPMKFLLTGAITNLILDPIMIFGYLGFPEMGVAGAAIATVIGQILSMLYALWVIFTKDHVVKVDLRGFRPKGRIIRDIYAVGFPSIIMQSISSLLTVCLNMILIGFSEVAVSVLGIYFKLQSFVFMPVFGLNQGVMPIMGYSYGARKKARLLEALKWGCCIAAVIMAAGTLLFQTLPEVFLGFFNPTQELLDLGVPALRIISISFIPAAFGIMFGTIFQATGFGTRSLFISMLRQLVVILPVAWYLSRFGVGYVWYSFPIAEGVSVAASILLLLDLYKHHIRDLTPLED
jgi:putative MATE family efflux protein